MAYFPFSNSGGSALFRARRHHAPSGVGRRVRRQDLGAVLPQVRHQPPGRHRGPRGDDQGGAHAREHRRRHRPPAERGDAEAHGGVRSTALAARPPPPPEPPPRSRRRLSAAILDRYVGEYKAASGFTATFRREGTTLFVKPGTNPEAPLIARSETRFQDPRGPFFEFQLDAQGKVTGAVLEQQGPQVRRDPAGAEVNREPERVARAVSVRRQARGGAPRNSGRGIR